MFLNEDFIKLYEELSQLNEAKEDQEKFIAKFGQEAFDIFRSKKQLLKNKGFNVDITYHVARTSIEEMQKILDSVSDAVRKTELDAEGKPIPENTNNFEIVYDGPHYTVYNPQDYIASIHCAHGGRWCTAGGYRMPEGQIKVSQAKEYFNLHQQRGGVIYYLIGKSGKREDMFALEVYPEANKLKYPYSFQFFSYYDQPISALQVTNFSSIKIPGVYLAIHCCRCEAQLDTKEALPDPDPDNANAVYCKTCYNKYKN